MATWRMVARVIGVAVLASCAEMPTDVREHEQPDRNPPPPEMQTAAQANGAWPNHEPAGMRSIFLANGTSTNFGSFPGITRINPSKVSVVSDPASKYGRAIEKRYRVGDGAGWGGGVVTSYLPGGPYQELYYRIVFRVSSNWQWHRGGGKFFYYGTTRHATRGHLGWDGGGRIRWVDFGTGVGQYIPNSLPPISRNVYHTIEVHHRASTNGANGFLRMWVNGVKVQSYNLVGNPKQNNVQLENRTWLATAGVADKRLDRLQAFMYWGGNGDVKRVNDWVRLSELYISGKK